MLNKKFPPFIKKILIKKFLLDKIFFVSVIIFLSGCAEKNWKDHGDSCILISENPPLRRVINYTDHDLCGRKLSPRIAPNPSTRFLNGKS